jgi:hypothetical protein
MADVFKFPEQEIVDNEDIEDALTEIGQIVLAGLPIDTGFIFNAAAVRYVLKRVYIEGKVAYLMAHHCLVLDFAYDTNTDMYVLSGQCLPDKDDVVYTLLTDMPDLTLPPKLGKGAIEHAQELVSNAQEAIDRITWQYVPNQSLLTPKVKELGKPTVLTFPVKRDIDFDDE